MKYRRLGNSGLKVSEIALGSWLTYGGAVEEKSAAAVIDAAYELGVNHFDTANMYALGAAERIVGATLKKYARESFVLGTKVYFDMGDGPNDRGLSRKHIMEQCDASLHRLGVDYIDIYYCHRYDDDTPLEETLRAMDDLVRQGKVLYIGVSEWSAAQIIEANKIIERLNLHPIVVNQPEYNMFTRNIEKEIVPECAKLGIGQVVFSPLAHGVLSGKYRYGVAPPEGTRATDPNSNHWIQAQGLLGEHKLSQVEQLKEIAAEKEISMAQLALAWNLRLSNVSSCIIGATRPEQVQQNVQAAGLTFTEQQLSAIEAILQSKE